MDEPTNSEVYPWRITADESPSRGEPVLCAWPRGGGWFYAVGKFTGKRWLEVIPETDNEEYYRPPKYWQEIKPPGHSASDSPK